MRKILEKNSFLTPKRKVGSEAELMQQLSLGAARQAMLGVAWCTVAGGCDAGGPGLVKWDSLLCQLDPQGRHLIVDFW